MSSEDADAAAGAAAARQNALACQAGKKYETFYLFFIFWPELNLQSFFLF